MLDFMDYIQLLFAEATNWNRDNSYSSLTATAQSILDFSTPERLRVHLSSLSTPHFATSYTLGTVGVIDGSLSYLFSTVPFPFENTPSRSTAIPLRRLAPGYHQIRAPVSLLRQRQEESESEDASLHEESSHKHKPTLLHAALHLPPPTTLNALFLRRISPTTQLSLAVCSTRGPPLSKSAPQASLLTQLSRDKGKYTSEYLFSTDNALFGWKGLWNFGARLSQEVDSSAVAAAGGAGSAGGAGGAGAGHGSSDELDLLSLLSAGAEAYYSPLSSLIGMSMGLRFSTLPAASYPLSPASTSTSTSTSTPTSTSMSTTPPPSSSNTSPISTFPYTLTLTLTPLTGSLSTTYSVCASPNLAFSSRFSFNVYSWESEMVAGCELWRQSRRSKSNQLGYADDGDGDDGLEWARRKMRFSEPSGFGSGKPNSATSTLNGLVYDGRNGSNENENENENESVVKIRLDQSWNIRLLWEGRVKELLVSAGVGLGPRSFSSVWAPGAGSARPDSPCGQSATAGGGWGLSGTGSYWRGVGVSVLYSS